MPSACGAREAVTPPQHRSNALNIDFVIAPLPIVIVVELHAADGGCTPSEACREQRHAIVVRFARRTFSTTEFAGPP
jgi:hypothetical protein